MALEKIVHIPDGEYEFSDMGGLYAMETSFDAIPGVDLPITVIWDGVRYDLYVYEFGVSPCCGNKSIVFGGTDSGIPFFIMFSPDSGMIVTTDTKATHTISVYAKVDTATYRWKRNNSSIISYGKNDNQITFENGEIMDEMFLDACLKIDTPLKLLHDADWALEWTMQCDVSGVPMAKVWDELGVNSNNKSRSISVRDLSQSVTFTNYPNNTHVHYGVRLDQYGIDYKEFHTYRLQNKVNADGTNMVYLYVDGNEVAPMMDTFDKSVNYGLKDWVVGKDFSFGYMGVPNYPLTNMIINRISVWESGASEVFAEDEVRPVSYIEYLVNPKYRMGKPFRGFFGWLVGRAVASQRGKA